MIDYDYPNCLVSIEQAKKLRELGFEEKCHFFWNFYEDVNKMCCYADINEEDEDFLFPNEYNYNNKNSSGYHVYLSIPTFEQALKWFREKGFVGVVEYEDFYSDESTYYYAYRITKTSGEIVFYSPNYRSYETYEEAREALINKLIELYGKE
jgi:hypothetical protein